MGILALFEGNDIYTAIPMSVQVQTDTLSQVLFQEIIAIRHY